MGPDTIVRDSYIHHNGQLGIHGGQASCSRAKGLVLADSELSFNNAAGYNYGWEGGATKWTHTDGLIASNNYIHDNYGSGLWTDGPNINVVFEGNRVEDNYASGIIHELGYAAVIRNNVVRRNGFEHPIQGDVWGAGILIDQSRDVEVYGNTVEDNAAGITAVQEPAGDQCGFGSEQRSPTSTSTTTPWSSRRASRRGCISTWKPTSPTTPARTTDGGTTLHARESGKRPLFLLGEHEYGLEYLAVLRAGLTTPDHALKRRDREDLDPPRSA